MSPEHERLREITEAAMADDPHGAFFDPVTVVSLLDAVAERDALAEALEETRAIAEEAVDRLRRIGDIYSLALCADIEPTEALGRMEVVMRGDPPEGEIRHFVLADALARIDTTVPQKEKKP